MNKQVAQRGTAVAKEQLLSFACGEAQEKRCRIPKKRLSESWVFFFMKRQAAQRGTEVCEYLLSVRFALQGQHSKRASLGADLFSQPFGLPASPKGKPFGFLRFYKSPAFPIGEGASAEAKEVVQEFFADSCRRASLGADLFSQPFGLPASPKGKPLGFSRFCKFPAFPIGEGAPA